MSDSAFNHVRSSGEILAGQAMVLADLVQYAPGSIVSRTIHKSDAGTITLFAFESGEGLSEHSAPFDAFVHVLEGVAEVRVGGKPIETAAGRTVRMPANVPHAVHAAQRFKMLLVMIRG